MTFLKKYIQPPFVILLLLLLGTSYSVVCVSSTILALGGVVFKFCGSVLCLPWYWCTSDHGKVYSNYKRWIDALGKKPRETERTKQWD